MNIDFHYGIIYVAARLGGLSASDAEIVAHACQYVDDATTSGLLHFSGGELFERFATAHKMLDYQNVMNDQNRLVWAPFHFLPAGEGHLLEERAVCRANSAVAQEVVQHALRCKGQINSLYRLGVTLHVYVDTWAHQGFAGIECNYNRVQQLDVEGSPTVDWLTRLGVATQHLAQECEADILTRALPLGHGAALSYPDQPWAMWHYINGAGEQVFRDNLNEFMTAAEMATRVVQAYVADSIEFSSQAGFSADARTALHDLLASNKNEDEFQRLNAIRDSVRMGAIPGIREEIPEYIGKGKGSWKYLATGIETDDDCNAHPVWTADFERSHYCLFHDAVKEHRFLVTQTILPARGLRIA